MSEEPSEYRSLKDRFHDVVEARKKEDPRITDLYNAVCRLRVEIRGINESGNLALGNSRDAVDDVKHLSELAFLQANKIISMETELTSLRSDLNAALQRIEKMAEWAKTIGKKDPS